MGKKPRITAVQGAAEAIKREFDGLPVQDAVVDLQVVVNNEEVMSAIGNEKDPENCVLAKACARQLRSSKTLFFRSVAYVEHPGPDGVRRVYRYQVKDAARAIIEAFDRGKEVQGNVAITLKAPTKGATLDHLRSKERTLRLQRKNKAYRDRRKARINGVIDNPEGNVGIFQKPKAKDISVRSGSGLVHMSIKKDG